MEIITTNLAPFLPMLIHTAEFHYFFFFFFNLWLGGQEQEENVNKISDSFTYVITIHVWY